MFDLKRINIIPKKNVSLNEMKDSEKLLTKKYETKYRSFLEMFEKRLGQLKGKKKRISVTVDVSMNTNNEIDDDEHIERPQKYKKFNDEYGVSYKKVKMQTRDGFIKEENMDLL